MGQGSSHARSQAGEDAKTPPAAAARAATTPNTSTSQGGKSVSVSWSEDLVTDMVPRPSSSGQSGGKKAKLAVQVSIPSHISEGSERSSGLDGLSSASETPDKKASSESLEALSEIQLQMRSALRGMAAARAPVKNFNSILMKFPVVRRGFDSMRTVFSAVDADDSGSIDFHEWCDALECVNVRVADAVPEDLALKLWREGDVDGDGLMNFKEFMVVVTFLYILGYVSEESEGEAKSKSKAKAKAKAKGEWKGKAGGHGAPDGECGSPLRVKGQPLEVSRQLKESIDVVLDAFLLFDDDCDGRIMKAEMMKALDTSIGVSGKKHVDHNVASSVWSKRFKEMDCDGSGSISLREFIMAIEDWAGIDDVSEEE